MAAVNDRTATPSIGQLIRLPRTVKLALFICVRVAGRACVRRRLEWIKAHNTNLVADVHCLLECCYHIFPTILRPIRKHCGHHLAAYLDFNPFDVFSVGYLTLLIGSNGQE